MLFLNGVARHIGDIKKKQLRTMPSWPAQISRREDADAGPKPFGLVLVGFACMHILNPRVCPYASLCVRRCARWYARVRASVRALACFRIRRWRACAVRQRPHTVAAFSLACSARAERRAQLAPGQSQSSTRVESSQLCKCFVCPGVRDTEATCRPTT
eukprot:6203127-Pleurochrysis_carterae.AAC.1